MATEEEITKLFPVVKKTNETMGRYLAASRAIEPGELVLVDTPIITLPNASSSSSSSNDGSSNSSSSSHTCLGCCGVTQTIVQCPKCGWPVCRVECGEIEDHANFECKVFSQEKIRLPLQSPYCFIAYSEYIKVLRCLLLKELGENDKVHHGGAKKYLERWNSVLELEAHVDLRNAVPTVILMSKLIRKFIQEVCKLRQFGDDLIDFVLGAIDVNAFRNAAAAVPIFQRKSEVVVVGLNGSSSSLPKNATILYKNGSLAAHGCRRNTQSLTYANGHLEMHAGEFIPENEPITHAYVDLMLGTLERRKLLKTQFYFDCTCLRCSDPTELGTHFSSLKCQACEDGYLLMDNPLEFSPYWKCDSCPEIQPTEYESELLKEFRSLENKILLKEASLSSSSIDQVVDKLTKLHQQYESKLLHQNHYVLLQSQVTLVKCLSKVRDPKGEVVENVHKIVEKYKSLYRTFYPNVEGNNSLVVVVGSSSSKNYK